MSIHLAVLTDDVHPSGSALEQRIYHVIRQFLKPGLQAEFFAELSAPPLLPHAEPILNIQLRIKRALPSTLSVLDVRNLGYNPVQEVFELAGGLRSVRQGFQLVCPGCGFAGKVHSHLGQLQETLDCSHHNPSTGLLCQHLSILQAMQVDYLQELPASYMHATGPQHTLHDGAPDSCYDGPSSGADQVDAQAVRLMASILSYMAMHFIAATPAQAGQRAQLKEPLAQKLLLPWRPWAIHVLSEDVNLIHAANWVRPSFADLCASLVPADTAPGSAVAAAAKDSGSPFKPIHLCTQSLLDTLLAPPWVAVSEPLAMENMSLERTAVLLKPWHDWLLQHDPRQAEAATAAVSNLGYLLEQRKTALQSLLGSLLARDPAFSRFPAPVRLQAFLQCAGISGSLDQALVKLDKTLRTKPHVTSHLEACAHCGLSSGKLKPLIKPGADGSKKHTSTMIKCCHCLVSVCIPCVLAAAGKRDPAEDMAPGSIGHAVAAEAAACLPGGLCYWCAGAGDILDARATAGGAEADTDAATQQVTGADVQGQANGDRSITGCQDNTHSGWNSSSQQLEQQQDVLLQDIGNWQQHHQQLRPCKQPVIAGAAVAAAAEAGSLQQQQQLFQQLLPVELGPSQPQPYHGEIQGRTGSSNGGAGSDTCYYGMDQPAAPMQGMQVLPGQHSPQAPIYQQHEQQLLQQLEQELLQLEQQRQQLEQQQLELHQRQEQQQQQQQQRQGLAQLSALGPRTDELELWCSEALDAPTGSPAAQQFQPHHHQQQQQVVQQHALEHIAHGLLSAQEPGVAAQQLWELQQALMQAVAQAPLATEPSALPQRHNASWHGVHDGGCRDSGQCISRGDGSSTGLAARLAGFAVAASSGVAAATAPALDAATGTALAGFAPDAPAAAEAVDLLAPLALVAAAGSPAAPSSLVLPPEAGAAVANLYRLLQSAAEQAQTAQPATSMASADAAMQAAPAATGTAAGRKRSPSGGRPHPLLQTSGGDAAAGGGGSSGMTGWQMGAACAPLASAQADAQSYESVPPAPAATAGLPPTQAVLGIDSADIYAAVAAPGGAAGMVDAGDGQVAGEVQREANVAGQNLLAMVEALVRSAGGAANQVAGALALGVAAAAAQHAGAERAQLSPLAAAAAPSRTASAGSEGAEQLCVPAASAGVAGPVRGQGSTMQRTQEQVALAALMHMGQQQRDQGDQAVVEAAAFHMLQPPSQQQQQQAEVGCSLQQEPPAVLLVVPRPPVHTNSSAIGGAGAAATGPVKRPWEAAELGEDSQQLLQQLQVVKRRRTISLDDV